MFQISREPEFAKRMRESMMAQQLRQVDVANKLEISRTMVGNWVMGYCKPRGRRLQQLARVLECEPVWLRDGDVSDIDQRIDRVMSLMRIVVRELGHINRALAERDPKRSKAAQSNAGAR